MVVSHQYQHFDGAIILNALFSWSNPSSHCSWWPKITMFFMENPHDPRVFFCRCQDMSSLASILQSMFVCAGLGVISGVGSTGCLGSSQPWQPWLPWTQVRRRLMDSWNGGQVRAVSASCFWDGLGFGSMFVVLSVFNQVFPYLFRSHLRLACVHSSSYGLYKLNWFQGYSHPKVLCNRDTRHGFPVISC